ncbi:hypothetical protein CIB48_g8059 [Xylaria polymorpha]|nr:hypothetical protein CIB48_g8059 [Xylaria polymorpha]
MGSTSNSMGRATMGVIRMDMVEVDMEVGVVACWADRASLEGMVGVVLMMVGVIMVARRLLSMGITGIMDIMVIIVMAITGTTDTMGIMDIKSKAEK